MTRHISSAVIAIALFSAHPLEAAFEQGAGGVLQVRVDLPKKTPWEANHVSGPVLVGPQAYLDFVWRIRFFGLGVVSIPSPQLFDVQVTRDAEEIPVRSTVATQMSVNYVATAVGSISVDETTEMSVRGVVHRDDGQPFGPGMYHLKLDLDRARSSLVSESASAISIDSGFPIELWVQALDTSTRVRHHHLIEAAFYSESQPQIALEHRLVVVGRRDATWGDWLALGSAYAAVGRHSDAVQAYRRILPRLMSASPDGKRLLAGNFQIVAASFAVVGDRAAAEAVLKSEGLLKETEIPATIERLRQNAFKRQPPR